MCPAFDADQFAREVIADLPPLALKARIARTSAGLHKHLPVSGAQALDILLRSLPATPEEAGITTDFGLHLYSPHSDYVARYCRTHDNLTSSLDALARMTPYFTAEDAARYFIADFPQETIATVNGWAQHPDHRVRGWPASPPVPPSRGPSASPSRSTQPCPSSTSCTPIPAGT